MYDENSMKSHIFWIKCRRIFLLLALTIIGTAVGVVVSDYVVNILMFNSNLRIIIVSVSAAIFLAIALLLTANTGKEIEDGYWKIAVYKKLAIISKKLDNLEPNTPKQDSKNTHNSSLSKEVTQIEEPTTSKSTITTSITTTIEKTPEIKETIENTDTTTNNNEVLNELKEITNTLQEDISLESKEEKLENQ